MHGHIPPRYYAAVGRTWLGWDPDLRRGGGELAGGVLGPLVDIGASRRGHQEDILQGRVIERLPQRIEDLLPTKNISRACLRGSRAAD